MQSILEQAGGSINSRETYRLRRYRLRPQIGNATIGRQKVGIPGIVHGLPIREQFSQIGPVSVGWETNFLTTDGCVDRTPTRTTHLCTQRAPHRTEVSLTTEHAWLKSFALVCQKKFVIPASCLTCCRTCDRTLLHDLSHLPHLSSDHLLPHCPVLPQLLRGWIKKPFEVPGGVAEWRIH